MKSIGHLPEDEQQHYILCDCGEYMDMRDLSDVFDHLHVQLSADSTWSHSRKIGEPAAYPRLGSRIDLN